MPPSASVPLSQGPQQQPLLPQSRPQPQSPPPTQQLHPEIRSVVQLNHIHAHKIYFSGPLIRKLEHNPDGQKPIKDEGWSEIWAQLGGTTLSIWDMKEIEVASKQGREVPPSYINVTDAYTQIIGSVTLHATPTTPSRRYPNVLTVNTAGANLYLFSCESVPALASWVAALRLAAWEKSRLDEIYTAHLIRITLTARDVPTTLVRGKMEGWARIRIAGQTDWKKVWLVVQEGSGDRTNDHPTAPATNGNATASSPAIVKKKRVSIFSSSSSSPPSPNTPNAAFPSKSVISMYSSPKPKDRKRAPLLTIVNISQAFAVYPERPELISKSTLMKVEGLLLDGEMAGKWQGREGWVFIMPEGESGSGKVPQPGVAGQGGQVAEMLKWIVALHDAFKLYGRPEAWTWDPRDPVSLMYGYPVGPAKESLFLERGIAETMDPREDKTSVYRAEFKKLLQQHMRLPVQVVNPQTRVSGGPPSGAASGGPETGSDGTNPNPIGMGNGSLPPLPPSGTPSSTPDVSVGVVGPQLPPFSFNSGGAVPFPTSNAPVNPNVNGVPANSNNNPSSRLSTIEESSIVTHSGNQHQQSPTGQNSDSQANASSLGLNSGAGGSFTTSLPPPPPPIPENPSGGDGAPAVPAKLPPSSMAGAPVRQPLYPSSLPSFLSQSQPQSLQESTTGAVPPRFQNLGQSGLGTFTPGSRMSPPGPGLALTDFGAPPSRPSRTGSPMAAGSPVPTPPSAATVTRPPTGPFGSSPQPNSNASINAVPGRPSSQPSRPQLQTSTSARTTLTTSSTTVTTVPAGGLDTEDLLKEPGVMFFLGEAKKQGFMSGYGAGVGAGVEGLGSGLGPGVGTGVGAGIRTNVGAGSASKPGPGVGTGMGAGVGVGSGLVTGVADNENDNENDAYVDGSGVHRDGETTSLRSAVASSNALAAPSPQAAGSLRAYAGIAESEDSHHHQQSEDQSGTGQHIKPIRGTPMSFVGADSSLAPPTATPNSENTSPSIVTKPLSLAGAGVPDRLSPTRFGSGLGRKPSGARELGAPRHGSNLGFSPTSHRVSGAASLSNSIVGSDSISNYSRTYTEDGSVMEPTVGQATTVVLGTAPVRSGDDGGVGEDALAALTYLNLADGGEHGRESSPTTITTTAATAASLSTQIPPPPPELFSSSIEPLKTRHSAFPAGPPSELGAVSDANDTLPYTESSFAPSNKAAERKAKVKAQKDAQLAAVHKPGRANGKKKSMTGAWDSSEEEEDDEEDDEEDEDVDSDGEKRDNETKGKSGQQQLQSGSGSASSSALGHGRPGSQVRPVSGESSEPLTPSQLRLPRNLPQIPGRRSPGEENMGTRRIPSDQYMDGTRRTYYEEGPQLRTQAEAPMPGAQRQTIWTKVLDPGQPVGRPQSEHTSKETFVQLEPSETMTKAFALHGLLSVGMQDKEDRSAKRQEELARETGASLVNVPNKPPPPQSGLLGYVTAHEKERKREGGLGATLTGREREKRIAEERQRRLDEQQRQQLDQMQQGMMFNPMMNPMMNMMMNPMMTGGMNPMMTGGMNPMMTGGVNPMMTGGVNPMMTGMGGMGMGGMNPMMGGFGGMMGGGGFNPQHMFAAQQAAQAYQQAMMTFSVAGSQVGGPTAGGTGGNGAEGGVLPSQGNNAGLNTGMSPGMGNVLSPAMTGNVGGFDPRVSMFGMMGMPSMGMGGGLGPQMTGMSNFDAMASPAFANGGGTGGMGVGLGMNASPNPNELGGGGGNLGLQPPIMPHSQLSSRTSSPAGRGSPKVVSGPNGEYHHLQQQHERGRPSRPASPK